MQVARIDHVNIAGPQDLIDACRDFYVAVLGLHEGHRPPFRSSGYWLYAGEDPIIHLSVTSDAPGNANGAFNHFALRCSGLPDLLERLRLGGIEHSVTQVPLTGATQVFLKDPAGVAVELNFPAQDPAG